MTVVTIVGNEDMILIVIERKMGSHWYDQIGVSETNGGTTNCLMIWITGNWLAYLTDGSKMQTILDMGSPMVNGLSKNCADQILWQTNYLYLSDKPIIYT